MNKIFRSIGLMSGTSMDGIDLALIESNGREIIERKNFTYKAYSKEFKTRLSSLIYNNPKLAEIKEIENELTLLHAEFINEFLALNNINRKEIDLVAFHGHTILHMPQNQVTWQIGNPHLLASRIGIDVVADFRSRDVILGGQGAPLVPIYHFHLFNTQPRPTAILNIGGISNITYFESNDEEKIQAFDVCFGNAPFDDLMKEKFGRDFDENGELAKAGNVDFILADRILQNDIFHKEPPKSFDRDDFSILLAPLKSLKVEDALATFAYMHAKVIQSNLAFLTEKPKDILVCGGGRKNVAIMDEMKKWLSGINIKTVEEVGFNGDSIEAEAFAFLGIRTLLNLPISFKKTTGVFDDRPKTTLKAGGPIIYDENANAKNLNSACGGVIYKAC